MASFRKQGGKWRAELSRCGHRESQSFDSKAAARAWAADREAELLNRPAAPLAANRSVRDAILAYRKRVTPGKKGRRWEDIRLAKLERELPFIDRPLVSVTANDLALWRDKALAGESDSASPRRALKPSTVRREWGLLRAVFAISRDEWGWLHVTPFAKAKAPREGQPRSRRISDQEIDRLLDALGYARGTRPERAGHYVAIALLLAVETAMRQGEIIGLTRDRVDLDRRVAQLVETKNGAARDVPLSTRAVELLELLPEEGPLFPVSGQTVDTLFRRARARTAIHDVHFHDSRREGTSRLAKKVDVLTLAKITGHRDVRVLLHVYYSTSMSDVAAQLG